MRMVPRMTPNVYVPGDMLPVGGPISTDNTVYVQRMILVPPVVLDPQPIPRLAVGAPYITATPVSLPPGIYVPPSP